MTKYDLHSGQLQSAQSPHHQTDGLFGTFGPLTFGSLVQPKIIHVNSVTDIVENVNFMYAPEERFISAKIPIQVRHDRLEDQKSSVTLLGTCSNLS